MLKHQAFEAEIAAHNNAILTLKTAGRAMLDHQHFATDDIKVHGYAPKQCFHRNVQSIFSFSPFVCMQKLTQII